MVDKAIEDIQKIGHKYQVCPFETVEECNFDELSELIEKIHDVCRLAGTEKMLMNLKILLDFNHNVTIEDKMKRVRARFDA